MKLEYEIVNPEKYKEITGKEVKQRFVYYVNEDLQSKRLYKENVIKPTEETLNYLKKEAGNYRKKIQEDEYNIKDKTDDELAKEILLCMIQNNYDKASELLALRIQLEEKFYTIRSDDKSEMWCYKEGIFIPQGKTFIKEYCRKLFGDKFRTSLVNQVITKIEADTYIDNETFFNTNNVEEICVNNGILNLTTLDLTEYTPEKIFFNKIPITYDPQATCPNIDTHFKTVLKNEEDAQVMYELFGFCLYKDYFLEKATMFIGDGRNGKGKTLELLKYFLGKENCASVPLQQFEQDPYSPAELNNKLANLAGDLSPTSLKNTGRFKELTGKDLISGQRKYLDRIHFVNFAKMIFACNKLPKTYDTTTAFWERWLLFDFPYTFKSQEQLDKANAEEKKFWKLKNPSIIDQLILPEELSGLLNKALEGLKNIRKEKTFTKTRGVEETKDMWIRKSDSFLAFSMDCLEADLDSRIEKEVLRKEYAKYCKVNKLRILSDKMIKISIDNSLQDLLECAVYEHQGADGIRSWEGIRFRKNYFEK